MVPQENPITRNPFWKSHSYLFCVVDQQSIAMMFRELLYGKTLVALKGVGILNLALFFFFFFRREFSNLVMDKLYFSNRDNIE